MAKKSNGPGKGKSKATRSSVSKMGTKKSIRGIQAKTARGKDTNKGEKDGRMAAARQTSLDKDVKKAGGSKEYLSKAKAAKSRQVKVGDVYTTKGSARHKAAQKKAQQSKKR